MTPKSRRPYLAGALAGVLAILGMLVGAAIFAEVQPALVDSVGTRGAFGKLTLPGVLGVTPWIVIPLFTVGIVLLFRWLERLRI